MARLPFFMLCLHCSTNTDTMFHVIAEARLGGGRLRTMYVCYASDTSRGGHIVWAATPGRSYGERDANALLAAAARESPEWGFRLQAAWSFVY